MSERGILFSTPMVVALIEGRKTQTRRVLKPQPVSPVQALGVWYDSHLGPGGKPISFAPGDVLWAREPCRAEELGDGRDGIRYLADDHWRPIADTRAASDAWLALRDYRGARAEFVREGRWVNSIHMPRWVSRATLTVTGVEVQRLQDIGEADAAAEAPPMADLYGGPLPAFVMLWNSLHGGDPEGSWEANPWVQALTFTVRVHQDEPAGPVEEEA